MLSRAHAPKTGKLDLQFHSTPRGAVNEERGNGEPDEPFRPCDLHACRDPRGFFLPSILIIASKRTQRVNTPRGGGQNPHVKLSGLPLPFKPMRLGGKRAHLGGAGGEPPAVLPRLLDLSNKCVQSGQGREGVPHV